jgi:hypothetical protein
MKKPFPMAGPSNPVMLSEETRETPRLGAETSRERSSRRYATRNSYDEFKHGGVLKPCREETAFWLTRAALKIYPKTSPLPFRALRGICFLVKPRGFEYLSKNFPVVIPSLARNLLFA